MMKKCVVLRSSVVGGEEVRARHVKALCLAISHVIICYRHNNQVRQRLQAHFINEGTGAWRVYVTCPTSSSFERRIEEIDWDCGRQLPHHLLV